MPDEVQQGAKRQGDKISRKFVWHECKSITVHERTCRYNISIILETCLRIQQPHIAPGVLTEIEPSYTNNLGNSILMMKIRVWNPDRKRKDVIGYSLR